MTNKLDALLNFHTTALNLRAQRQQLLAANVANADVPNYKARDIDFAKSLEQALGAAGGRGTVSTATRHLQPAAVPAGAGGAEPLYRVPLQNSIDGNTVELDVERAQFADNAVRMEASLMFLNSQIKSMLTAIQG